MSSPYNCLMYTYPQKHQYILRGFCNLVLQACCAFKQEFCARILNIPLAHIFHHFFPTCLMKATKARGPNILPFPSLNVTQLNMREQFQFLNPREFCLIYPDVPFGDELVWRQTCFTNNCFGHVPGQVNFMQYKGFSLS